jgi:acyl phosphate:glycerol-3-phosphate acyltransferase
MAMFTLSVIVVCLLSYVVGSIPSGFLVAKRLANVDLRTVGSGSTGATNVLRVCGKGPALFVMAFDIIKGIIPVAGAVYLDKHVIAFPMSQWHLLAPLSAICLLIGHSRSLFLRFKGGKSAATALGALIALNTWTAAVVLGTWILLVATVRIVSVASL